MKQQRAVNSFPALTAPCPFIFLSSLSITDKAALLANLEKTYLAKETAIFICALSVMKYFPYYEEIHIFE